MDQTSSRISVSMYDTTSILIHPRRMQANLISRFVALLMLCFSASVLAEVPRLNGWVNDRTGLLTPDEADRIERQLKLFEGLTRHSIVVLTVPGLDGESIESFSMRVARAWGLGSPQFDNGILLTVALKERKVRIELGAGMTRYVSDEKAAA